MKVNLIKQEKNETVIEVTVNKNDEEFIMDKYENFEKFKKEVGESVGAALLAGMVMSLFKTLT